MRRVFVPTAAVVAVVITAILAGGGGGNGGICPTGRAHAPDGPDLWGTCWPGPRTVGVPAGTVLTDYAGVVTDGSCIITVDGTTITAKTVDCKLVIRAANVVIDDSLVLGGIAIEADWPNIYSFTVTDSDIDALVTPEALYSGNRGVGKNNFVAERNDIYGGISGAWCEYNCTLRGNYIHGQGLDTLRCRSPFTGNPSCLHQSGLRGGSGPSGQGQTIEGNTVVCEPEDQAGDNTNDSSGCSADVTQYGDFAPIQNNTFHRNLFMATPGGTGVYGGSGGSGSKPFAADANHNEFTENVFVSRSDRPCTGYYFCSADFDAARPGNVWTGNKLWNPASSTLSDLNPNV